MLLSMKTITLNLSEYTVEQEPDHKAIGEVVDDAIKQHFPGQTIIARGLSSNEHPNKTVEELIEIIQKLGTDRYEPERAGDRYENIKGKHIDFFAFRRKVTPRMELFKDISWGFYHGAKAIHGKPVRIDLLTIYDAAQLKAVVHQYEGHTDIKRDGFIFKRPENKTNALLGIIKVN